MIKLASLWEEHGLIFATKTASLINPSNLHQRSRRS
jgi:hypothetical protein